MIERTLSHELVQNAKGFPILALLGPRQSGKTTLAKELFKTYAFVNLEEHDHREFAMRDPRRFLAQFDSGKGVILDEIQNVPSLFSYLQAKVDQQFRPGFYVITGSHNYLLNEAISQSLAGRVAIHTLLPLSVQELSKNNVLPQTHQDLLQAGMYPVLYDREIVSKSWYTSYVTTYVEKDVRQIIKIADLMLFKKFLSLCAGRIGQLLNYDSIAIDCGVSPNTIRSWISLLESSYILFLLRPYYKNFNKRVIKSPKIFFYDVGLACHLLGIHSPELISNHYMRGGLFESFVMSELMKKFYNQGQPPPLYFWRDRTGREIDCIIETAFEMKPIEVKAGMTVSNSYFDGLKYWYKITHTTNPNGIVIYGGDQNQERKEGRVVSWRNVHEINV